MCSHVVVNGVDCFSVDELIFEIGSEDFIVKDRLYQVMPRGPMCLCGVDLPATAKLAGFNCSKPDDADSLYVFESGVCSAETY